MGKIGDVRREQMLGTTADASKITGLLFVASKTREPLHWLSA